MKFKEGKHDELTLRDEWGAEAKGQTLETLPAFLKKLANFDHEYGTIPRALGLAAYATAVALDKSPKGGITGFQASFVAWEFLRAWFSWADDDIGHTLVDYNNLMYPQYDDHFNSITPDVWERLQKAAQAKLDTGEIGADHVVEHWKSIAAGVVPFGLKIRD